jgi:hypothetical protein
MFSGEKMDNESIKMIMDDCSEFVDDEGNVKYTRMTEF